jgi:peptidoglycan hydrolase-like protein with peptidoglycan-binding domain
MGNNSDSQSSGARGVLGVPTLAISCAVVMALMIGGAIIASHSSASGTPSTTVTATSQRGSTKPHDSKDRDSRPPAPLRVASVVPFPGASSVGWRSDVTVRYNEPITAASLMPMIRPAVAGSWDRVGPETVVFRPTTQWVPFVQETVIVPKDSRSTDGTTLGQSSISTFTVAGASALRLQELLAELGYLPVAFTPKGGAVPAPVTGVRTRPTPPFTHSSSAPASTATTVVAAPGPGTTRDIEPSVPGDIPREALAGRFAWRFTNIPTSLADEWTAGSSNEVTTGAVMAFESANGLPDDGVAGPAVWQALLQAAASRKITAAPYDYVYVSEGSPEYVTIWRDGVNVFTTLANTGIPQAPTVAGTWPVYVRYTVTTMSGTNPDGSTYSDPGIPWVSYFHGGDALHGYLRSQYGFPQSLGCVEMPYSSADTVFPYTPIGTLVTIE